MTPSRIRRAFHRAKFPLAAGLSAVMYLVIAAGVPLPMAATVEKDLSQPFPCMNSPCGCQNAEQCWRSCCCHTPAERLAWAKAHGIAPPACLIAADMDEAESESHASSCGVKKAKCCAQGPRVEGQEVRAHSSSEKKMDCCANANVRSLQGGHSDDDGTAHSRSADHERDGHSHAHPAENQTVILIHALGCQGHGTDWLAGFVALAPKVMNWEYQPQPTATVAVFTSTPSSPAFPPSVPPPRFSAA